MYNQTTCIINFTIWFTSEYAQYTQIEYLRCIPAEGINGGTIEGAKADGNIDGMEYNREGKGGWVYRWKLCCQEYGSGSGETGKSPGTADGDEEVVMNKRLWMTQKMELMQTTAMMPYLKTME